jgi:hypothetical protein
MENPSRPVRANGQNDHQNGFLQVAGAPITPITGTMNPPTLRHIPPSPETNLIARADRDDRQEDASLFLGASVPHALQGRRGSKDTADSHVSAESGPALSDSDYGSQGVHGRIANENNSNGNSNSGRRSSSRHRPSESKSGGMSVSGFFRRKRDRTASASQADIEGYEQPPFLPPESLEGYSVREGTDSSFDNSDRMSRDEGGRGSATMGKSSLRRKASTSKSFTKTKQGIDRLALGIEHAFSLKHRPHQDKDISDCETGYNSTDSRTPGVELDNAFDNQGVLALRRRPSTDQGSHVPHGNQPYGVLSPSSHDIARRNSTLLLQEMNKSGGLGGENKKLIVKVPSSGDAAGNLVSPNVSPRLQSAGITSAHSAPAIAEPSRPKQIGLTSSQTFSNMMTGPRLLSYGETDHPASEDGHTRSHSALPQSSQSSRNMEQMRDRAASQRDHGASFVRNGDTETAGPGKEHGHSRNRTLAIVPSAVLDRMIPPERKSSRVGTEPVDGSMTLGRSRSRTLTVPSQGHNDSASDRATSDGEHDARRRTPKHRSRASESVAAGADSVSRQATETSSSARRGNGSRTEILNGSGVEQSGSEDPYSETPEKPHRSVRRLPVPTQREKGNGAQAETNPDQNGHSREKSSTEVARKTRNSEGKSSRTTRDRDKDREGRSSKKENKRERVFAIPAADVAIASRTSE